MSKTGKLLISGSFLRVFTLAVNVLIAFYMMPFIIHSIGDRWYGLWVLVGTFMGYFGLLDFGLSTATQRFITRSLATDDKQGVNEALSTSIAVYVVLSFVSIILSALAIHFGKNLLDNPADIPTYQIVLVLMGLKVAIAFPFYAFSGMLVAKLRYDIASYIQLFKLILRTILIVVYISKGYSIIALAAITLVTETLGYFVICFYALRLYPDIQIGKQHIQLKKLKEFYDYSKYIFITSVADMLRSSVDNMVIAKYISLAAVTHYVIAARLIEYFGQFMMSLLSVVMPIFTADHAKDNHENLKKNFFIVSNISAFTGVLLGGVIIVSGNDFIKLWMGVDYLDAYIPLVILCFGATIAMAQTPSVAVLNAIAKHRYYSVITIVEAVFNLILSIILVQYYGLIGVALGTAIPAIFSKLWFQPRYVCREIRIKLSDYCYLMAKHLFFGIVFHSLFFLYLNYLSPESILLLVVYTIVYVTLYTLTSLKWVFDDDTKSQVRRSLPEKVKVVYDYFT